nr:uncharacterized protein LOC112754651 [Arachis hypogaea]
MPTITAPIKGTLNKEATIIKEATIVKEEITTMVGKTIPTKDGGTIIIKEKGQESEDRLKETVDRLHATIHQLEQAVIRLDSRRLDTQGAPMPSCGESNEKRSMKETLEAPVDREEHDFVLEQLEEAMLPKEEEEVNRADYRVEEQGNGVFDGAARASSTAQQGRGRRRGNDDGDERQPRTMQESTSSHIFEKIAQPIPFPTLARRIKKKIELDPKMVEIFKKVGVTIPLFDSIYQVPKYAKFLKDLCMHKERIHELETIPLGSSISALMGAILEKCGDPGPCLVTCTIDGVQFIDCVCDLGACVSIMPLSVYHILKLPPLKRLAARFVLADKSIIMVAGIAKDVLVNIKGLDFPIDFHILEMPPSESERTSSILLGRPFLRTSRFKLDVFLGTYSFEIDGRVVSFSLDEAMRHPPEDHSIFRCDLIDNVMAEVHSTNLDEKSMIQGPSVGNSHECEENTLPTPVLSDDQMPSQA